MPKHILYLSYDGLTDALGQSQILAYQKNIASTEHLVTIISFEKKAAFEKLGKETADICAKAGIDWQPLFYTKNPPVLSTALDLYHAWKKIRLIEKNIHIDIVHCRGYIAALLGEKAKNVYGSKFIFDMRGWWPDEKLESGYWSGKLYQPIYRFFKKKERDFFQYADIVVSLTEAGKAEIIRLGLKNENDIKVISTCTDLTLFRPNNNTETEKIKEELGFPSDSKVLIYSGALGGNYPEESIYLFVNAFLAISPNHYCLILSKDQPKTAQYIPERTVIRSVSYKEVSRYLAACDLGFIYYKKAFSNIGRCPTKLGEYWACGLPAISPSEVGDVDALFNQYKGTGETVSSWTIEKIDGALRLVLNRSVQQETLLNAAQSYFSLAKGVDFYKKLYNSLID